MKKIVLFILLMLPVAVMAQKDVTTFLGIPVDGTKSSMTQSLKNKGFVYKSKDFLTGEFNGNKVNVQIFTNNGKVWRLAISDAFSLNETDIKIRFNKLVSQFSENPKYIAANLDANSFMIQDDEQIMLDMGIYHKRYEASFYQKPDYSLIDTLKLQNEVMLNLQNKFGRERLQNPDDQTKKEISNYLINYTIRRLEKKFVWFMISEERFGEYYITMFYDNEYNRANGEDL